MFLEALMGVCRPHRELSDTRLAKDVTRVASSGEEVVLMLARCLPHIVPNVLLAKREVGPLFVLILDCGGGGCTLPGVKLKWDRVGCLYYPVLKRT